MDRNAILQNYWDQNIGRYSAFYDTTSEEALMGFKPLLFLYRKVIFPIEKKVTRQRYEFVKDFIGKEVTETTKVADVGCGGGVFTKLMADIGASGYALDFAPSALELTKARLTAEQQQKITFKQYDATSDKLPTSNVCLVIGVMPYIEDLGPLFANILPNTDKIVFNFLEKTHPFNLVRIVLPFLNVRNYSYHRKAEVLEMLKQHGFKATQVSVLSTGYLMTAERIK